jgi:hypothetical protein
MGKTVESYRIALEQEINRWSGFARALRREDLNAFEELLDMCRSFASESSNATNPIIFEPMVMSILLAQQEKIKELENELHEIFWLRSSAQTEKSPQQQDTPRADSNKTVAKQAQGGLSGYG